MPALSVNVNKIALLRNSREGKGPDVARLARLALDAGAAGVTVHPRPDGRHVRAGDVRELSAMIRDYGDGREFNVEGNPFEGEWLALVKEVRPDQATLVPDAPGQSTSDHGFDMTADAIRLKSVINELREAGCRVSVFMDPDPRQVAAVPTCGADRVELYTESFAVAHAAGDAARYAQVRSHFAESARAAAAAGLGVNAGHDLNLSNLADFTDAVGRDVLLEVSIGHALVGDAIELGLAEAVRRYNAALAG